MGTGIKRTFKCHASLQNGKEGLLNHRLVSLTLGPRKAMEQLILETISKHINDKVIRSSKHGFIKGKSYFIDMVVFYDGWPGR